MQVLELLNQFEEIENAKVLGNAAAAEAADSALGRRNRAEAFDMIIRQFFASESTQAVLQLQEWVQQIREQRTRAKDARTREADSVLIASLDTDGYVCVAEPTALPLRYPTPWCRTYPCAHFAVF
jgi:hypothetical protein